MLSRFSKPRSLLNITRYCRYSNEPSKLDFNDSAIAFRTKSSWELVRSLMVFKLCTIDFLVDNNKKILSLSEKILGKRLFEFVIKKTVYGHFVAGKDETDIKDLILLNRSFGVKSILDYSVEEDVSEAKAKQIVKKTMDKVLDKDSEAPTALDDQFKISLEFADRTDQVTSARTYFYTSEEECDKNVDIIKRSIDVSAYCNQPGEGFTAVKLTALGPPTLLMHISEILNQLEQVFQVISSKSKNEASSLSFDLDSFLEHLDELNVELTYDERLQWFTLMDLDKDNNVDLFEWLNLKNFEHNLANIFLIANPKCFKKLKTGQKENLIQPLSQEGIISMRKMLQRLDSIVQHAKSKQIRVMIDAEQSYFQPAIRRLTLELMRRYNKDRATVFNTYQCYLKSAHDQLLKDLILAERQEFYFGAKLVRGAYMEQERERSKAMNYEDPVCETYEATTAMYNKCLNEALNYITSRERGQVLIMVASHNCDTVKYAIEKCKELNIRPEERLICFGQLLGMCDRISFNLGNKGYSVYKYMPYGPVLEVMPYLSRRALENRTVLKQSKDEVNLIRTEIIRRIKTRSWSNYPEKPMQNL